MSVQTPSKKPTTTSNNSLENAAMSFLNDNNKSKTKQKSKSPVKSAVNHNSAQCWGSQGKKNISNFKHVFVITCRRRLEQLPVVSIGKWDETKQVHPVVVRSSPRTTLAKTNKQVWYDMKVAPIWSRKEKAFVPASRNQRIRIRKKDRIVAMWGARLDTEFKLLVSKLESYHVWDEYGTLIDAMLSGCREQFHCVKIQVDGEKGVYIVPCTWIAARSEYTPNPANFIHFKSTDKKWNLVTCQQMDGQSGAEYDDMNSQSASEDDIDLEYFQIWKNEFRKQTVSVTTNDVVYQIDGSYQLTKCYIQRQCPKQKFIISFANDPYSRSLVSAESICAQTMHGMLHNISYISYLFIYIDYYTVLVHSLYSTFW